MIITDTHFPDETIELLAGMESIAVLTGAGISAESGVATFRDKDGLWSRFNPAELASMDGFLANPQLVWDWYQYRRGIIDSVQPNPGHRALAEMEELFPRFTLSTQNVDRLHQSAGSRKVLELHGNIIDNFCVDCRKTFEFPTGEIEEIPRCECGGLIRPSVVWFGEMLPEDVLRASDMAARQAQVYFSIGTSAEVFPAAQLPLIAQNHGAVLVEINPHETQLSSVADFSLRMPAGEALPALVERIKQIRAAQ